MIVRAESNGEVLIDRRVDDDDIDLTHGRVVVKFSAEEMAGLAESGRVRVSILSDGMLSVGEMILEARGEPRPCELIHHTIGSDIVVSDGGPWPFHNFGDYGGPAIEASSNPENTWRHEYDAMDSSQVRETLDEIDRIIAEATNG